MVFLYCYLKFVPPRPYSKRLIFVLLQIGGELTDFIIVLHDSEAVKTFCSRMHFSLGAGCSAAAGPVGRVVEADLRAGEKGSGICYTYSCSKGNEAFDLFDGYLLQVWML